MKCLEKMNPALLQTKRVFNLKQYAVKQHKTTVTTRHKMLGQVIGQLLQTWANLGHQVNEIIAEIRKAVPENLALMLKMTVSNHPDGRTVKK